MSSSISDSQFVVDSPESLPETVQIAAPEQPTYGEILKSSALVGGASAAHVAIRIVRAKALAVLLGPAGFGLFGLYGSVSDLAQNVAGMGVNSSGVRQIAEAAGSGDAMRIAQTAAVLRRTAILLGLLGAGLVVVFSRQISVLTFGNDRHSAAVCLLSVAVLFKLIAGGQGALIQGMRRIADLAKMDVLGGLFGAVVSIIAVYFLRDNGVVLALVGIAAMTIFMSWWYSRKLSTEAPSMTLSEMAREAGALLKLGSAFMSSGLVMMGVAYAVRIIVLHKVSIVATGFYQSAWAIGGLYVGFILQAMAADFYPRLTASISDHSVSNRLVNEQARVGLLLAGPGVIATLTFAPLVLTLLFSAKFGAAAGILRWICLGAALQVVTWPMGFIIVAKGRAALLVICEVAWGVVHVGLAWVCISSFGVNGAGIAYFGSYIFHIALIYPIVHALSGFRWSADNKKTGLLFFSLIAAVFCALYVLPFLWAACLGTLATLLSGFYSVRVLSRLVPLHEIPAPLRRLVVRFGLAPADSHKAD